MTTGHKLRVKRDIQCICMRWPLVRNKSFTFFQSIAIRLMRRYTSSGCSKSEPSVSSFSAIQFKLNELSVSRLKRELRTSSDTKYSLNDSIIAFSRANPMSTEKTAKYPEMHYFLNELESDVVFIVEEQRLPARKFMMELRSEVFRAMFSEKYREMPRNFRESTAKEVVIEDTTYKAFKIMLKFLYTELLAFNDDNDIGLIGDVLTLADRYQLDRLFENCEQHLMSMLTMDNMKVVSKMVSPKMVFGYRLIKLKAYMEEFFDKNYTEILAKDQKVLNKINTSTDNLLFEVMAKNFRKVDNCMRRIGYNLDNIDINEYDNADVDYFDVK
ncbi:unnamed protein product [Oppiella nova]|uniref:BTB domain-containing protein n=1 Tax=Oppiella nova TaxID=334625 RepID=A0A7R9LET4_9ACAR|nr:unnamed protein product [Oppiella nova]CAG2162119.1 unnamed protein product [Oppiella nova]